jgi:hypothetical protein
LMNNATSWMIYSLSSTMSRSNSAFLTHIFKEQTDDVDLSSSFSILALGKK